MISWREIQITTTDRQIDKQFDEPRPPFRPEAEEAEVRDMNDQDGLEIILIGPVVQKSSQCCLTDNINEYR